MRSSITSRELGHMPDGRAVTEYTLDNGHGLSLSAMNLGGIVTALRVPDRHGQAANVVLGCRRWPTTSSRIRTWAASWGAMPTASRRGASRSTAPRTSWA
jgi:galactose mutarotase-like enzyme